MIGPAREVWICSGAETPRCRSGERRVLAQPVTKRGRLIAYRVRQLHKRTYDVITPQEFDTIVREETT